VASASFERGLPDVRELRRSIYRKGEARRSDLETLIALGRDAAMDPEFAALAAEVAVDALVRGAEPAGCVGDEDSTWLALKLGEGGGLDSRAEFEILKAVLGQAVSAPPALTAFATREVEKAILTGRREAMGGVDQEPGIVTRDDVEALRAMAFAPTRGAAPRVDRGVAEALFDIAHATATAANDPAFAEFFARAVGDYLAAAVFADEASPRPEAERHGRAGFAAFFAALARAPSREDEGGFRANPEPSNRSAEAERIDDDQAKWVIAHLTRGGPLTAAETRLLRLLVEESASSPAALSAMLDRAA
jgi:hypothetical protein